jgi:hypothetical protein
MKMAVMKLGNIPRPAAWSPSSYCFLPSVGVDPCDELIQLSPSSCGGDFLVNRVGKMVGCEWSPLIGRLGYCIYAFGESWGVLHHALQEIFLGREANLVSINSASSRFSWFAALPCRHHISHVRTPNNAYSVSRLYATKLSSTVVFIAFLENEDNIPKTVSEDNVSDFRLVYAAGISGSISPSSLTRIGPSTCPNWRYRRGPQVW